MLKYPLNLEDDEGNVLVTFPDVNNAITFGTDRADAILQSIDCLKTAFVMYQSDRIFFPIPEQKDYENFVVLPYVVSLKILFYNTMIEKDIRKVQLAYMAGWNGTQIERILDPYHNSNLHQIEYGFSKLGKRVEISLKDI